MGCSSSVDAVQGKISEFRARKEQLEARANSAIDRVIDSVLKKIGDPDEIEEEEKEANRVENEVAQKNKKEMSKASSSPTSTPTSSLTSALAAALRLDAKQMDLFQLWCQAAGIQDRLDRALDVDLYGDGTAVSFAVTTSLTRALEAIPALLQLLPNATPLPPERSSSNDVEASSRTQKRMDLQVNHGSPPPKDDDPQEASRFQPPSRLTADAEIGQSLEDSVQTVERLQMRPKAKSKSKVKATPESFEPVSLALDNDGEDELHQEPKADRMLRIPVAFQGDSSSSTSPSSPALRSSMKTTKKRGLRVSWASEVPEGESFAPAAQSTAAPVDLDYFLEIRSASNTQRPSGEVEEANVDRPAETAQVTARQPPPAPNASERRASGAVAMSLEDAALRWQESLLEAATKGLRESNEAAIWLHLDGLGLPTGVTRTADVGLRLRGAGRASLEACRTYDSLAELLISSEVTEMNGWGLEELGCSLFAHGPLTLCTLTRPTNEPLNFPSWPSPTVQRLAGEPGVLTSLRASLQHGDARLAYRFELTETSTTLRAPTGPALQLMDLGLGDRRVFDPLLVERLRQAASSAGCSSSVKALELRTIDEPAVVTIAIT